MITNALNEQVIVNVTTQRCTKAERSVFLKKIFRDNLWQHSFRGFQNVNTRLLDSNFPKLLKVGSVLIEGVYIIKGMQNCQPLRHFMSQRQAEMISI